MITPEQLRRIMPLAGRRADAFAAPLGAAMAEYEIATPARAAAFLAQVAHESGQLRYVRELASGRAYEWRADLGNFLRMVFNSSPCPSSAANAMTSQS